MEATKFNVLLEQMEQMGKQMDETMETVKEQIEQTEQTEPKVFWELLGHDTDGNAIIKVYKDTADYENQVDRAEQREQSRQKAIPKVTLDEAEKFDRLMDTLIKAEVTYVVPNRRTGKNVEIDYDVLDGTRKKGNNGHSGSTTTTTTVTTVTVVGGAARF